MKKAGDLLYNYTCKYIAECVVAGLQAGGIGVPALEAGKRAGGLAQRRKNEAKV